MRRKLISAALTTTVMAAGLLADAGPAEADTSGDTCGNSTLSDGSVVARACVHWTLSSSGLSYDVVNPKVWNPPNQATVLPVYAIFKPFIYTTDYIYMGGIADGETRYAVEEGISGWGGVSTQTVRFEIQTTGGGHTQCIYIVPGSHSVTNGHCP